MQFLFIDGDTSFTDTGIALAARSWYELAPHSRIVVVWSALSEESVLARANRAFGSGVDFRAWLKGLTALNRIHDLYGSDALVVDHDELFLAEFRPPTQLMSTEKFVDRMANEPGWFECGQCGTQHPAPAYLEVNDEAFCASCALPSVNEQSTEDLLQMITAGLTPDQHEALAAVGSLRWKLSMTTSDQNVRLVIERHHERAEVGLKKYGVTTQNNPLSMIQWMTHFGEELADAEVYAQEMVTKLRAVERLIGMVLRAEKCLSIDGQVALKSARSMMTGDQS